MTDQTPEQVIADALDGRMDGGWTRTELGNAIATALRAAGLLPGPGDIVVSREALRTVLERDHRLGATSECSVCKAKATLRAALSQPHPAQEQQT